MWQVAVFTRELFLAAIHLEQSSDKITITDISEKLSFLIYCLVRGTYKPRTEALVSRLNWRSLQSNVREVLIPFHCSRKQVSTKTLK